jgi:hypothetical protein
MKSIGILSFILGLSLTIFAAIIFFLDQPAAEIKAIPVIQYEPGYFIWVPLLGIALFGIGIVVCWQALAKSHNTLH